MTAVLLILRYRLRAARRFMAESAFVLAVLTPLVVGAVALVVDRYVPLLRARLEAWLAAGSSELPGPFALGLAVLLTAFGVAAAFDELFPRRTPTTVLDLLPVTEHARFAVGWLAVLAANGIAGGTLVALGWLLGRGTEASSPLIWVLPLALAFLPLTGVQMIAAQLAVRGRLLRPVPALIVGAVLVVAVAAVPRLPAAAVLLAPWLAAAAQLESGLTLALGLSAGGSAGDTVAAGWPALLLSTLVAAALAWWLSQRYRRRDLAAAHALRRSRGGTFGRRLGVVAARLRPVVAAQLVRDVLLVVRRFSPVVYVATALALLADLLVAIVVPTLDLSPFWRGRLALIGAAAAVLALVSLVPFVLRHELPRFWFERAAGVDATEIWRTKLWLARLLAVPGVVVGAIALTLGLGATSSPAALALVIGELIVAAWVIASLLGMATFEIADRPLLGLVFGASIALAFAALMILYRQFLPFWLVGYAIVAATVGDRATRRVRFTEVVR